MTRLAFTAAFLGFASVAFGAFGAHGLDGALSAEAMAWWETATFYALPHAVAALAVALSGRKAFALSGWAFCVGAIVFAGSLYAMALGGPRILGMITPVGGVLLLAGWTLAGLAALRGR